MLFLIILLPMVTAFLCTFCKLGHKRSHIVFLTVIQAVTAALMTYAVLCGSAYATGVWHITDSIIFSLALDDMGKLFGLLISVCWLLTVPYAGVYMEEEGCEPRFYTFLFLTECVMLGASFSADFFTFYLFYEMVSLVSFPLVLHDRTRGAIVGAGKYFYYSVGGAFLVLFGLVALSVNGSDLIFTTSAHLATNTPLLQTATICIILGFACKAGLYPLHNWLPSAHPTAPAPASGLLSGVIAKIGVLGIIRLLYFILGSDYIRGTWVQTTLLILALLTISVGSYMGCMEAVLKKRLAYSSISQISYILLGIFMLTPSGLLGALLQLIFHAAAKLGIFQVAGTIIFLTNHKRVDQFRGLGKRIPFTMVIFVLFSLSLIGIPPFGGFWSKWYLGIAALESLPGPLAYIAPAILILSALLTAGYLAPPVISAFFPGENCPPALLEPIREPRAMLIPMLILVGFCGILGFVPNAVIQAMTSIAAGL